MFLVEETGCHLTSSDFNVLCRKAILTFKADQKTLQVDKLFAEKSDFASFYGVLPPNVTGHESSVCLALCISSNHT